jgi:hypothetical protein
MQTFYRPIDIFREQSTRAATRLLQRKKLCQSTIFFALTSAPHAGKLFWIQPDYFAMNHSQ